MTIGGCTFIIVLYVAAYWEPDIRWLHFLQSWMYIAAIALSWKGNSWGYFIGFSAAALLLAYQRLSQKHWTDVLRLLVGFVGTTGFFALAMALTQPRYLVLFRQALHPHLYM
jgi:nicotinamide riboside transporter PnuC